MSARIVQVLIAFLLLMLCCPCLVLAQQPSSREAMYSAAWNTYHNTGNINKAQRMLEDAVAAAGDTEDILLANTLSLLAKVYGSSSSDKPPENEKKIACYEKSVAIREKLSGPDDLALAEERASLGWAYQEARRYAEAIPLFELATTTTQKIRWEADPRNLCFLEGLAQCHESLEHFKEAEALYLRLLRIDLRDKKNVDSQCRRMGELADFYGAYGDYDNAETLAKQAIELTEKTKGSSDITVAYALQTLAVSYYAQGQNEAATATFARIMAIGEKVYANSAKERAMFCNSLGGLYICLGNAFQSEGFHWTRHMSTNYVHSFALPLIPLFKESYYPGDPYAHARAQAMYAHAEPLLERAYTLRQQTESHQDTVDYCEAQSNLAAAYVAQGKYALAEPLLQQALEHSATRGLTYSWAVPDILQNLTALHLGQAMVMQKRVMPGWFPFESFNPPFAQPGRTQVDRAYQEGALRHFTAAFLYLRALTGIVDEEQRQRRYLSGEIINGYLYDGVLAAQQSLPIPPAAFQRAATLSEQYFGPLHPDTLAAMTYCVSALSNFVAERMTAVPGAPRGFPFLEEYLARAEKAAGQDNPRLVPVLLRLAWCYPDEVQEGWTAALLKRALMIQEKATGKDSAALIPILINLACCEGGFTDISPSGLKQSHDASTYENAKTNLVRALALAKKSSAADSVEIAGILFRQAECVRAPFDERKDLFERVLAMVEKTCGADSPEAITVQARLLNLDFFSTGKNKRCRQLLALLEQQFGADHPALISVLTVLLWDPNAGQRQQADAVADEPILRRIISIQEKALGPDHPLLVDNLLRLADTLSLQGKSASAEPLLKRAVSITESFYGAETPQVANMLDRYAALMQKLGRKTDTDALTARAKAIRAKLYQ